jgi:hypothetical protein
MYSWRKCVCLRAHVTGEFSRTVAFALPLRGQFYFRKPKFKSPMSGYKRFIVLTPILPRASGMILSARGAS